jgi:hypothetical protein
MNAPKNPDHSFSPRQANRAGGRCRIPRLPNFWCRRMALVLACVCLMLLFHCSRSSQDNSYLIRVGGSTVTVSEFNHAVEAAAEDVYPGEQEIDGAVRNELRMRVLNQMAEELIITERAKTLGIQVSDEELERAVAEIKSDYPDDTFEKTLLENAVSFQAWKKKLAIRLLINKVIESQLVDKVEITSNDVADYFQSNYPEGVPEGENAEEINQRIVQHLRHQKAEEMYQEWIEELRKTYPVDVDRECWNRLVGIKSR